MVACGRALGHHQRKRIWNNIDYVNIGGGLPAEYKNSRSAVFSKGIFGKISELRVLAQFKRDRDDHRARKIYRILSCEA
jgi:diaminopimelate decarboxylase